MLHRLFAAVAHLCALALSSAALADPACDDQFLDGKRPMLAAQVSADTELCSAHFATLWSSALRSPLYSAEHLTQPDLQKASDLKRRDQFHADARLPAGVRAELRDFAGQKRFDRGHLAPAHDMPDAVAEQESFALTNMIAQNKTLNRGAWAQIEATVRTQIVPRFRGEGWVVSGAVFATDPPRLKGRVAIPQSVWKAVWIPGDDFGNAPVVGAWVVRNAAKPETRFVSLDALRAETGADAFPDLPAEVRAAAHPPAVVFKGKSGDRP